MPLMSSQLHGSCSAVERGERCLARFGIIPGFANEPRRRSSTASFSSDGATARRAAAAARLPARRVADDIAERLAIVRRTFPVAVNLGAHHGLLSRRIRHVGRASGP